jgi:hypothetical protein
MRLARVRAACAVLGIVSAACAGTFGCAKRGTPVDIASHEAASSPEAATGGAAAKRTSTSGKSSEKNEEHGRGKGGRGDTPVVVDGVVRAALRFGELPPSVPFVARPGDSNARFFRVADYLRALGVEPSRMKAVHFIGNRDRVSSIERDELLREPSRFVFDFARTTHGNAAVMWDTTGLKNPKRIDFIRAVAVFVDKEPPPLDRDRGCYADGETCAPAMPEEAREGLKGTRVYQDGKLLATVKRRALGPELAFDSDADDGRYSLRKYLESVGVDLRRVKSVEFVHDDDVVARELAPSPTGRFDAVQFVTPRRSHGRLVATFPSAMLARADAPSPRLARVDAIVLYRDKAPRGLPLLPLGEAEWREDDDDRGGHRGGGGSDVD